MSKPAKEGAAARRAYTDYVAMDPPRSLQKLAAQYRDLTSPEVAPTRNVRVLKRWSATFGWQARVTAHDERVNALIQERAAVGRAERTEKLREERLLVARGMRGKAAKAIDLMEPKQLAKRPYAVVQMAAHADQTERLDMGEVTARTAVEMPTTFTIKIDAGSRDIEVLGAAEGRE